MSGECFVWANRYAAPAMNRLRPYPPIVTWQEYEAQIIEDNKTAWYNFMNPGAEDNGYWGQFRCTTPYVGQAWVGHSVESMSSGLFGGLYLYRPLISIDTTTAPDRPALTLSIGGELTLASDSLGLYYLPTEYLPDTAPEYAWAMYPDVPPYWSMAMVPAYIGPLLRGPWRTSTILNLPLTNLDHLNRDGVTAFMVRAAGEAIPLFWNIYTYEEERPPWAQVGYPRIDDGILESVARAYLTTIAVSGWSEAGLSLTPLTPGPYGTHVGVRGVGRHASS